MQFKCDDPPFTIQIDFGIMRLYGWCEGMKEKYEKGLIKFEIFSSTETKGEHNYVNPSAETLCAAKTKKKVFQKQKESNKILLKSQCGRWWEEIVEKSFER
jgi:hypothetical protein